MSYAELVDWIHDKNERNNPDHELLLALAPFCHAAEAIVKYHKDVPGADHHIYMESTSIENLQQRIDLLQGVLNRRRSNNLRTRDDRTP